MRWDESSQDEMRREILDRSGYIYIQQVPCSIFVTAAVRRDALLSLLPVIQQVVFWRLLYYLEGRSGGAGSWERI